MASKEMQKKAREWLYNANEVATPQKVDNLATLLDVVRQETASRMVSDLSRWVNTEWPHGEGSGLITQAEVIADQFYDMG